MSARTLPSPGKRRLTLLFGAALAAALASARPAWAADDAVRIACPDLTTERAAELESRIRANLLSADLPATVRIACRPEHTDVRVEAGPDNATVLVSTTSGDTFRDDVLRGVEEALEELSHRARARDASHATEAPAEPVGVAPAPASTQPAPRATITTLTPTAPIVKSPPALAATRERAWIEFFGAGLGEAWLEQLALGGALGVAHSTPTIWYGVRAAILRPATASTDFAATECHASAELGIQPRFLAGFRASIGLGPSVLFVAPNGDLTTRNHPVTSSLFVAAHVSRLFWFDRLALLPEVGVRLFAVTRGVRIDAEERLALRGFAPVFSLGLVYRLPL